MAENPVKKSGTKGLASKAGGFFSKIYWRTIMFFKSMPWFLYNAWLTGFPSYTVRTFYLRHILGIKIGKGTAIHTGCFFAGKKITIDSNTVIARNC